MLPTSATVTRIAANPSKGTYSLIRTKVPGATCLLAGLFVVSAVAAQQFSDIGVKKHARTKHCGYQYRAEQLLYNCVRYQVIVNESVLR